MLASLACGFKMLTWSPIRLVSCHSEAQHPISAVGDVEFECVG